MKKSNAFLIVVAVLLAVVGVEVAIDHFHALPVHKSQLNETPPRTEVKIGGPFTLVDHTGRTVTQEDFHGRYLLVYFGYTFCPDICPTVLHTMMTAYGQLSPEQQARVISVFITLDPARDTVAHMGSYVSAFHPALIGLTGTTEQITALAKSYKVYFAKVEPEGGKPYLIDHSSIIYLMDPRGSYYTHFGHGSSAEALFAKLKSLPWPAG